MTILMKKEFLYFVRPHEHPEALRIEAETEKLPGPLNIRVLLSSKDQLETGKLPLIAEYWDIAEPKKESAFIQILDLLCDKVID